MLFRSNVAARPPQPLLRGELQLLREKLQPARQAAPAHPALHQGQHQRLQLRAHGVLVRDLPISSGIKAALGKGAGLTLGVRPEHLSMGTINDVNMVSGKLFANENMGPEKLVTFERQDGGRVTARIFTDDAVETTENVAFTFDGAHATLFDSEGKRIPADGEMPL